MEGRHASTLAPRKPPAPKRTERLSTFLTSVAASGLGPQRAVNAWLSGARGSIPSATTKTMTNHERKQTALA